MADFFDKSGNTTTWFPLTADMPGWFDADLSLDEVVVTFDQALMAAINQPQHLLRFEKNRVVASGMKPTNLVNT